MVVPSSNSLETKLFKLMSDKDKLESQINTYGEILVQNGNVGMNEPLVDADGFPRNDIDVYKVRQARQQIICLQNDHKALMEIIEQLMHELHANTNQDQTLNYLAHKTEGINLNGNSSDAMDVTETTEQKAILVVKSVASGSPAEQAGLRRNDVILEFGTVNGNNFNKKLDIISKIVSNMRGNRIPLKVIRNNEILNLILIPQRWSGPGLLGCNVVVSDN